MNKTKKNIILQTLYQIITTITPLITAPYLSRTLGAKSLGDYSYSFSIVNYFILFSMLGFVNYGTRTIASLKSDVQKDNAFWSIYYLQLFSCVISSIIYFFVLIFNHNNIFLLCQFFWLLSCFFDVTWFYFGKEDFKTTVIRNLLFKIVTIILIFIFVKSSSDLTKYILILSCGTLTSQFTLWIMLIGKNAPKKIKYKDIIIHLKPVLILFVPILSMSVYHIMDKTMLGLFSSAIQSGFYYNADKVINIPLCIFTGIGTVMLPTISSLLSKNEVIKAKMYIQKSIKYLLCFSIAITFGLVGISKDFVPFFFGDGYDQCIILIKLLSVVLIFKSMSDIIRTQYMIPFKKEKYFVFSVVLGAITNFLCNILFISFFKMGALGATIGTIIAEVVVCFSQFLFIMKEFNILKDFFQGLIFLPIGFIMMIVISFLSSLSCNVILKLFLEISLGGLLYLTGSFIILFLKKDDLVINLFSKFKNKKI